MMNLLLNLCLSEPQVPAVLEISGKNLAVYDSLPARPRADVLESKSTSGKRPSLFTFQPIHFSVDANGFSHLTNLVQSFLQGTPTHIDGKIYIDRHCQSFHSALISSITFPSFGADSGSQLIQFEVLPDQVTDSESDPPNVDRPALSPLQSCHVSIDGVATPSNSGVDSALCVRQSVETDGHSHTTNMTYHYSTPDVQFTENAYEANGVESWAKSFLIDGQSSDAGEKTVRVAYGAANGQGFTLNFLHCGIHEIDPLPGKPYRETAQIYTDGCTLDSKAGKNENDQTGPKEPTSDGVFGTEYYVEEHNWTANVLSAEYRADRFVWGETNSGSEIIPQKAQKLLVAKIRLKNTGNQDLEVIPSELHLSVVDARNETSDAPGTIVRADDQTEFKSVLSPGKAIDLEMCIPMRGGVPGKTLKVYGEHSEFTTSFDLLKQINRVASMPKELLAPGDDSGAVINEEVRARIGSTYPVGVYDVTPQDTKISASPINGQEPGEGNHFWILTTSFTNLARHEVQFTEDPVTVSVFDSNGTEYSCEAMTEDLSSACNRTFQHVGQTGAKAVIQFVVQIPIKAKLVRAVLQDPDYRIYNFELK
ncbi:MAG: hypothetical protein JST51_09420 [Armatimonadetes bacterium]|nr:hypothetical protein [Armatimonadota bacterium]